MKLQTKLVSLMIVFVMVFSFFALMAYITIEELRINSPLYSRIVLQKDLVADVLPPPEYIIESYFLALQSLGEQNPDNINEYVEKGKRLEEEFIDRHEFWAENLPEGTTKQLLVEDSYKHAMAFYDIRDKEFYPAIQSGDNAKATELAYGSMLTKYESHRQIIDEIVKLALQDSKDNETLAADLVESRHFFMLAIAVGSLLVLCVLALLISRSIARPIRRAADMLKDISEGEGDLTKRLEVTARDEIGDMANHFNRFVEKLQGIIARISGNAETVASSATELSAVSAQTANSVQSLSEKTSMVAAAAEESSANTTSVAASMEQASASLSSMASATEEMSATIGEIAANSEKARAISSEAGLQAASVSSLMQQLGQAAHEIGKVTETITEISSQTNLLALNATIEAARAGAAGKGFAVVANEIKELAKQTASATEDIKAKIGGVQSSAGSAITDIEKITGVISEVGHIVSNIATAIEEQAVVTRDVA
ncbi:MAG: methyl-accepting chemotaxis protein, partial [Candidatus Hydrogenedentes bacterium]|nr:methyl-accepting chemotaxis protein [Candidatus Hydrogenedentota bacterium]